ncbi:MAG: hypothetical protein ACFFCM_14560 [Promethearchaeota archaeon]
MYIAWVIDFNPFLLLELRGKSKNEIISELSLSYPSESRKKIEKESTNQKG